MGSISREGDPHFSIGYTGLLQYDSIYLGSITRGHPHFSIGSTCLVQYGSVHLPSISRAGTSFLNRLYWFDVIGFCTLGLIQQGGLLISQFVILVRCSSSLHMGSISREGAPHFSIGYTGLLQYDSIYLGSITRGPPHFSIGSTCLVQYGSVHLPSISRAGTSFLNRLYWFDVVGFCTLGLSQQGGLLISQWVILVWCSNTLHLESISRGGPPHFSIGYTGLLQQDSVHLGQLCGEGHLQCSSALYLLGSVSKGAISFPNRFYWFGVVGLCTLGLISRGGPPHFSIGSTGLVQFGSAHQGQLSAGGYLQCSRVLYTLALLVRGPPHFSIFYTSFGVVGLCTLGLISRGGPPHFSIGYIGLM